MLKAFLSAYRCTPIYARSFAAVGCLVLACCFVMGCSPAAKPPAKPDDHADHDHTDDHDHPKTLAAGITSLETLCGDVKAAMAEKDVKKADPVLHEIGHLLEDIQSLQRTQRSTKSSSALTRSTSRCMSPKMPKRVVSLPTMKWLIASPQLLPHSRRPHHDVEEYCCETVCRWLPLSHYSFDIVGESVIKSGRGS